MLRQQGVQLPRIDESVLPLPKSPVSFTVGEQKFFTEKGNVTWGDNGEWTETGGGGTAWDTMSFDPDLNLMYIGTGNGSVQIRRGIGDRAQRAVPVLAGRSDAARHVRILGGLVRGRWWSSQRYDDAIPSGRARRSAF